MPPTPKSCPYLPTSRRLVFISHATPEDNDFARWLAVKLAAVGYLVWADVEKLIGGEKFWKDIEEAITQHSIKVLFCGSKASLGIPRAGVMKELQLARKAEEETGVDILVPLRLDDIPFNSFPDKLSSEVNIIRFDLGWAQGLKSVIKMLEREKVAKSENGLECTTSWWMRRFSATEGVTEGSQTHVTNIFPFKESSQQIWFHQLRRTPTSSFKFDKLPFPARPFADGVITPENPERVRKSFSAFGVLESKSMQWASFINGGWPDIHLRADTAQKQAHWMLRFAFQKLAHARKFEEYQLSGNNKCFWLKREEGQKSELPYNDWTGSPKRRALIGYNSYGLAVNGARKRRFWHFAIQARPVFFPMQALIIKSHVIFTEDGKTPIVSDSKQHSARRSVCKSWWNHHWRDRILCAVAQLAENGSSMALRFGDSHLEFSITPLTIESARSYSEIEKQPTEDIPFTEFSLEDGPESIGENNE